MENKLKKYKKKLKQARNSLNDLKAGSVYSGGGFAAHRSACIADSELFSWEDEVEYLEGKIEKLSSKLTPREQEILELIAQEDSSQMIADKLFISVHTVTVHRTNIAKKLKAINTAGIIMNALRLNLIQL